MLKSVVGAQLWTVRDYLKTPDDVGLTLKKVREIGYKAVQLTGNEPVEAYALKEMTDREGLVICASHMPFERIAGETKAVIDDHKLWDCKYVGIGMLPEQYRDSKEGYRQFAREASKLGEALDESGIQLVYHNHDIEFMKFDGTSGMDILLEESDPGYLKFELDTYWVQAGGADPAEWIRKLKGRMPVVHLKDMGIMGHREPKMAEIGEGNLNWQSILKACEESGVLWYIIEQDICERDPFVSLDISLRNLAGMGLK